MCIRAVARLIQRTYDMYFIKITSLSAPAEAGGDNGHRHVVAHALVHQSAEDDVRVGVHVGVDHFSRRVNLV